MIAIIASTVVGNASATGQGVTKVVGTRDSVARTILRPIDAHARLDAGCGARARVQRITGDCLIHTSRGGVAVIIRAPKSVITHSVRVGALPGGLVTLGNCACIGVYAHHVRVAACPRGVLRHSVARVVRTRIPVVAVSRVDAAVCDALPAAGSCIITDVHVRACVPVVAAVPRLRCIRATVYRVAEHILGARVAVFATDWRAPLWRKAPRPFAITVVVDGTDIVVTAE